MSPIENVVPNLVPEPTQPTNLDIRNKQDRSRDLFGVQLEVTSLLLEAERRKLAVLQRELQVALEEGGSIKAKEHQKQELLIAIARIQAQYDHLDKEYREHAIGALLSANTRGSGKSNMETPPIDRQAFLFNKQQTWKVLRLLGNSTKRLQIPSSWGYSRQENLG